MSSLSRKLFPPCETAIPRCLFRRRKSVEFWRVGGRRRPAAGTILPEPVKILEGPAAEGIHADILGFPSLELQLKLGRKLNLELNRKCRGAAPPRAVVIHFQRERRYAHTFSNHPVSNNDRESRPGGGGGRRPQSSSRAPAIPVKNSFAESREEPERMPPSQSLTAANARVLPWAGRHANTLPRGEPPLMQPEQLGSSDFDKAFPDKPRGRLPYSPLCCHFADSSQIRYLTQSLILQRATNGKYY